MIYLDMGEAIASPKPTKPTVIRQIRQPDRQTLVLANCQTRQLSD